MTQYLKIPYWLAVKNDLSSREVHVYLALSTFNPCFPSHQALCERTGMSLNTLVKTLRSLKKKKLVSWTRGRKGKNNTYFLRKV